MNESEGHLEARSEHLNDFKSPGERVYYKGEAQNRWLGPAKVIFQDGKVIFVRHGATCMFVRVSPNQLTVAGMTSADTHENVTAKYQR